MDMILNMLKEIDIVIVKMLLASSMLVVYWLARRFSARVITRMGVLKDVDDYRLKYIVKTIHIALTLLLFIFMTLLMGVEYSQVAVFLSSVFAVIGVALFAQWSILSNITASLIIFFAFPYRVGDTIQIVDNDDSIKGVVEEITLFHVIIRQESQNIVTYPNSLILQKPVVKLNVAEVDKAIEDKREA